MIAQKIHDPRKWRITRILVTRESERFTDALYFSRCAAAPEFMRYAALRSRWRARGVAARADIKNIAGGCHYQLVRRARLIDHWGPSFIFG